MTTAATGVNVGQDRSELDPKRGFDTPADVLLAVREAALSRRVDQRLKPLAVAGSDEQFEGSDPLGGFLMPTAFAPEAIRVAPADDPAVGRTRQVTMQAPVLSIGARVDKNHATSVSGGLAISRHLETTTIQTSRMQVDQLELNSFELIGFAYGTNRLLDLSPRTFVTLLDASFRDELASVMLEERVRGTGTGEFLGILRSPCLITVDKETGQAAGSVTSANLIAMRARCWGYQRAVWIANSDLLPQLMTTSIEIGTAGDLFPAWKPGADGEPDTLLGKPLFLHDAASMVGQVGDLMCCNWGEYLDATYQPASMVSSIHVRFLAQETAFRFYTRNDGMPHWRSPLTPKRSTSTLSPFVTLAARP